MNLICRCNEYSVCDVCRDQQPSARIMQSNADLASAMDAALKTFNDAGMTVHPTPASMREQSIRLMLEQLGEDPDREGLQGTPKRVIKAWSEMCKGYSVKASDFLTTFENEGHDMMVLDGPIKFYSTCEHHLLPFWGSAWVAYIPDKRLVGLSKLARIVEMYSRRLQNQERLTSQVVDTLMDATKGKGAACLIKAQHMCRMARGVSQDEAMMTTPALRGAFLSDPATRAEFFALAK